MKKCVTICDDCRLKNTEIFIACQYHEYIMEVGSKKKTIKPLHFKINAVHWQCLDEDNKVKIVY